MLMTNYNFIIAAYLSLAHYSIQFLQNPNSNSTLPRR